MKKMIFLIFLLSSHAINASVLEEFVPQITFQKIMENFDYDQIKIESAAIRYLQNNQEMSHELTDVVSALKKTYPEKTVTELIGLIICTSSFKGISKDYHERD